MSYFIAYDHPRGSGNATSDIAPTDMAAVRRIEAGIREATGSKWAVIRGWQKFETLDQLDAPTDGEAS